MEADLILEPEPLGSASSGSASSSRPAAAVPITGRGIPPVVMCLAPADGNNASGISLVDPPASGYDDAAFAPPAPAPPVPPPAGEGAARGGVDSSSYVREMINLSVEFASLDEEAVSGPSGGGSLAVLRSNMEVSQQPPNLPRARGCSGGWLRGPALQHEGRCQGRRPLPDRRVFALAARCGWWFAQKTRELDPATYTTAEPAQAQALAPAFAYPADVRAADRLGARGRGRRAALPSRGGWRRQRSDGMRPAAQPSHLRVGVGGSRCRRAAYPLGVQRTVA